MAVALIPARSGTKRIPSKNVRALGEHPLIAYTIAAANASDVFDAVLVSTDAPAIAEVARHYGAEAPFLRPADLAGDTSPDIGWVRHGLEALERDGRVFEAFSILRPTNPFRQPETIRRAWALFRATKDADSLRAVELVSQHPAKMWRIDDGWLVPFVEGEVDGQPWHSVPYQSLPSVYVQNASLEFAWTSAPKTTGTISGRRVLAFRTEGYEGFDINHMDDWRAAEHLVSSGAAELPPVTQEPFLVES